MNKNYYKKIGVVVFAFVLIGALLYRFDILKSAEVDGAFDVGETRPSYGVVYQEDYKSNLMVAPSVKTAPEVYQDGDYRENYDDLVVGVDNQKIVKSGNLTLETLLFNESIDMLKEKINSHDGYITNISIQNGGYWYQSGNLKNATILIKVPSDKYDEFLLDIRSVGHVVTEYINMQDISSQYYDTARRMEVLQIQEERLLDFLKKAVKLEDIIVLERELSNVRYQIESLTASLKQMDGMLAYSSLNVTLVEVEKVTITDPDKREAFYVRLGHAITEGFSDFKEGLEIVILNLARNILLIAFMAIVLTFVLIKKVKLKKRHTIANKASEQK